MHSSGSAHAEALEEAIGSMASAGGQGDETPNGWQPITLRLPPRSLPTGELLEGVWGPIHNSCRYPRRKRRKT